MGFRSSRSWGCPSLSESTGRDAFVAEHREALRRYLVCLAGDRDLADDLVQEAFVRWMERPPRSDENPRAWLFTVATNLLRDRAKACNRRRLLLERHQGRVPQPSAPPDPAEALARSERIARVRRALDDLSERDRVILLMREEGFTHREIARAVGTTTKSVGTMIARALDKLAHLIDAELEAP